MTSRSSPPRRRRLRPWSTLALLAALAGLAACASPTTQFYTLAAVAEPPTTPIAAARPRSLLIAVGPVNLAGYLERPQLVVRQSAYAVTPQPFAQWAAPLVDRLPQVLGEDLSRLLPGERVIPFPPPSPQPFDYQVVATIEQFDVDAANRATLIANWQLLDFKTGRPLIAEVSRIGEPADDGTHEAHVAALSRATAALAGTIAQGIATLPAPLPAPSPPRSLP